MDQPIAKEIQSIPKFCKKHEISRAFFYKLQGQGKAPKVVKLGRRSIITPRGEYDWLEALDHGG